MVHVARNKHVFRVCARALLATGIFFIHTQVLMAQGRGFSEKRGKQTMNLSIPILNFAGETTIHGEFNLGGEGGLAFEFAGKKDQEEALEKDLDKGVSRLASAQALSFHYAKYDDAATMSGFYWGLGAGYRRESVDWLRPDNVNAPDFAVTSSTTWKANLADLEGPTGHGRLGYRYVGKDWPLLIGAFAGLRHFSSQVKEVSGMSKARAEFKKDELKTMTPVESSEISDKDKTKLKNIYATRMEGGVEIGFSF